MHFLLFYEYAPNYLQDRTQYRAEHLKLAWAAKDREQLVLAGALADPPDGVLCCFSKGRRTLRPARLRKPIRMSVPAWLPDGMCVHGRLLLATRQLLL